MVLPIYLLGTEILRTNTEEIRADSEPLQVLIDDMIATIQGAGGIGLAAPQVGLTERLFIVDLLPMKENLIGQDIEIPDQPMVFINPTIVEESDEDSEMEEGCLSIPDVHEEVLRPEAIRIRYLDRNFQAHNRRFYGMLARVIQHEFDHLEGILFIDLISPFKRRLLKRKLKEIIDGEIEADYPVFVSGKGVLHAEISRKTQ